MVDGNTPYYTVEPGLGLVYYDDRKFVEHIASLRKDGRVISVKELPKGAILMSMKKIEKAREKCL